MENIFQLKITLNDISPPIWRRIHVNSDTLLFDLHKIIQTTMGWTNSHLHQFVYNDRLYCNPEYEEEWDDSRQVDYSKVRLDKILLSVNQHIIYEYDFGDGWEHIIELEKIIPVDIKMKHPICIDGKRNCPPEDCGGPGGYEDLLEAIKNPENEEYESMLEWVGDDFDSEYFDKNETNEVLRQKDFGCITILDD
jgi:hypothetical protein